MERLNILFRDFFVSRFHHLFTTHVVNIAKMVKLFPSFSLAKRVYSGVAGKVKAQKYVLSKYFQGEPKKTDFKIVEEELPALKEGGA